MTDECKLGGGDTGEEGGCLQAVVCRLDGARERKIGRADRKGREGGRWRGVVCGFGSSVAASLVLPGYACVRVHAAQGAVAVAKTESRRKLDYCRIVAGSKR